MIHEATRSGKLNLVFSQIRPRSRLLFLIYYYAMSRLANPSRNDSLKFHENIDKLG
jgi:hypothetical protein